MSQQQQQLQQNHAHVASSPATVIPSLTSVSLGRHNNEMHMYDSSYGGYGSSCGNVGLGSSSSCSLGAGMGVMGGSGSVGGGCMYDLEMRCGTNSVAYAHNQLLQYHQQQSNMQISRHQHPAMNRNEYNDMMSPRKDIALQQQQTLHYQQQHHQHQQQLRNSMSRQSSIDIGELTIKSEPPDEHNYKTSFIDDNEPFVDFVDKVLNPAAVELNVKEENSSDMLQQKAMNFPRRKLQTERSETLPICQRCKQVFFKKHVYASHVAESTCDIIEYDFKCSICPMSFTSMEELAKHKLLHRENKFFCHKFCGKFYNTIEDCEKHEYMQHEYKTFVCNICSGTFPAREMLYAHLPVHKFQQRFDCSVCRLWFQTPHELHEHKIGAPYFCGKYYMTTAATAPVSTSVNRTNYHNPMMLKSEMQTTHDGYKLQDCHMGTIEVPTNQFHSSGAPPTNATTSNSFMNQRHAYSQQQQQQHHQQQQQQAYYNSNNFFPAPPVKTEIKVEPDFYAKSTDCQQQQQQQQQHQLMSQNYSDYTNDSFSSSHNSSSFANDFNESGSSSLNAQQTQSVNASSLDDSEDAVCCVPRCGVRKSTSPTLQFFTFPKDDKYLHQWLSNLKMLHIPAATFHNYRICSLHFPKRCINRYSLCYWAVPTFNLGHDDVANLYQNRELTNTFTIGEVARCSMPNCKSQRGESNVKFYNFPKDIKSLIKWCQNARLPVQSKEPRHFCGRHFEERCIGKFRLKPWAVPTLNLGTPYGKIHDNPQNLYVEEKRCCLPFCRRSRSSDFNMSLYRFPRDEVLLQRWCYNLRLDPSVYRGKNHKICSAHFIKEALGLRKLSPGAVPTLNLGHNDTFNVYENELYSQPTPPPPPPPPPQPKQHYRHSNHMASMSTISTTSSINSSMYFPMDETSPFSSVTCASSTPNVTESMDVCCVPDCESKRNDSDVTFHTIPRRPEQMQKWCHNLKMEEEKMHKGLRICSLHFEPFCIGGCMRPFAVPTLKLGHDDENIYRNPDVIKKLNIRETCCVQICKRNRERDHANLHRFPSNPIMLQKWCENLHKPVPDGSRLFNDAICEVHFEDRCLRNKRLEKWSIPTLNLGHNNLVHILPSEAEVAELYAKPSAPNNGDEEGECCVESCRRNPQVDDIRLYRTPEDPDLLAKWAHNLQIDCEDLTILRICNLHFESHCIGKRMHSWAIPTLNLGSNIENLFENPERPVPIRKEKPIKYHRGSTLKATWVPRCCMAHCRKVRAVHNVQLYRFPSTNRAMLAKWCHNLQVPLVGSAQRRVCSAHFIPEVLSKKCPVPHSVPTLDLNQPPNFKIYQNPAKLKTSKLCLQRICIVESCRKKRSEGVHLFRFPHNIALLRKWLHNIKQRPKGSMRSQYRICSSHFAPHSFNGNRLSSGAIPTLNLGHDDIDIYPNEVQSFIDEQCTVPGCDSVKDMPDVRLFRFPTDDEDNLWKWCNNLKMNPIDCHGIRICNKHFVIDCIGPKHLYKWAVPTLALGHDDTEIELMLNPKIEERRGDILYKCCVQSCGKTRKFDEVQMNSFPKDPKQFRRWKYNLKLEYLEFKEREKYKICNDHFEDICIAKTRLNIGAVPTLNLGHVYTEDLYRVDPDKIQTSLFVKNRPVLESATTSDDSEGEEEEEQHQLNDVKIESGNEEIIIPELEPPYHILDHHDSSDEAETQDLSDFSQVKIKMSLDTIKCCVSTCRKSRLQHGVRLYNFPSGTIQLKKWRHNVQQTSSTINKQSMICELHFHKRCIDGRELRSWAVPTMNLGHSLPIYDNPKNIPGFFLPICALNHCRKRRTIENDLRTYQFPKGILLEKWCANLKLQTVNCRGRICAEHFEPEVRGKLKLKTGAVPTLKLGHGDYPLPYDNNSIKEIAEKHRDFNEMQIDNTSMYEEDRDMFPNSDEDENNEPPDDEEFYDPLKFVETVDENIEQEESVQELSLASSFRKEKPANNVSPICCLQHCRKEKTAQHHLSTFGFPKNRDLLLKWCDNLKLSPADCIGRVCVEHFDPEVLGSRKLKQGAVPTINVGHNEPLRYTNYGMEMSFSSDNEEGGLNLDHHSVDKLNHSVFRLRSLKHSRKRKYSESEPTNTEIEIQRQLFNMNPTKYCCVGDCQQMFNENNVQLYHFPKRRIDYLKWQHNLQLKVPSNKTISKYKVCADHFEECCFNGIILLEGSIPTLNLGHSNCSIYTNPKKIQKDIIATKCFVPNCLSIYVQGNKLHSMPTSKDLCRIWYKYFNVKEYKIRIKSYICGFHFLQFYEDDINQRQLSVERRTQIQAKYEHIKKSVIIRRNICSVPGCNTMCTDDIRLTKLPTNDELCNKWLFNTKIIYNEKQRYIYRICMLHFETKYIVMARPKLWAVPTLNLNHNDDIYINNKDGQSITTSSTPHSPLSVKAETESVDTKVERSKTTSPNVIKEKQPFEINPSKYCCVRDCQQKFNKNSVSLHRFPKRRIDYLKWQHNLQLKVPSTKTASNYKVCSDHFEEYCFKGKFLLEGSIPTLNLGHTNCSIYTNPKKIQIDNSVPKCFVPNCLSVNVQGNKLHPMPTSMNLCRTWYKHFNVKEYRFQIKSYICGFHFVHLYENDIFPKQLSADGKSQIQAKYERIKKSAIITKNMCSVPDCKTMYTDDIRLTKLPTNDELCNKWLFNTKIIYNEKRRYIYRICLLHFEKQFLVMARPKLWAVPTLNLKHNDDIYINSIDGQSITTSSTPQPQSSVKADIEPVGIKYERAKTISPKRVPRVCCINKCINEVPVQVRLFKFPTSDVLLQKWCVNTQKAIAKADSLYVCEKHFEPDAICKQELRPWAVPTLSLNHNDMIIQNAKHLGNFHSEEHESEDMIYIRKNYCAILSCFQKESEAVRLYQYPSDMALIRRWACNCKHRSFAASKYCFQICQDHFADDCFEADKQLRIGAVPTLNLGLAEGQSILQSEWVEAKPKTPTPCLVKCSAPKCESEGGEDNRFFRFPKSYNIYVLWCKNLNVPVNRKFQCKLLCQLHFQQHCFTEQMRLHKGALPTLHLGHNNTDIVTENPSTFERVEELLRCSVPQCAKTKDDDGIKLTMFPRSRRLFDKWAHNLKIPATTQLWQSGRVCSIHFEPLCFENGKIKYGAMPTLHLGHSDTTDIHYTNELTLGKKKKSNLPVRVVTPNSISLGDLKCCFPNCKEFENAKLKEIFNVPTTNPIIRQKWCELMSCDPLDMDLKVCPLHYIINYEATIDDLMQLEDKERNNSNDISELEESYHSARNNTVMITTTCTIPNCLTLLPRDHYRLYSLPCNQDLLEKWLHNMKMHIDDVRCYSRKICSLHFEKRCINEVSKRLKTWAVPTLNIPHISNGGYYENPTDKDLEKPTNKCCIQVCENSGEFADITISLHAFPLEADILKKWMYNTQQKMRNAFGTRVCALHFEKYCFGKKRLHTWAIPTLDLGHNIADIYKNPSDKRLTQIKASDSNESEESRLSYCNTDTNISDVYKNPSDKRLEQIKASDLYESEESRLSYCNTDTNISDVYKNPSDKRLEQTKASDLYESEESRFSYYNTDTMDSNSGLEPTVKMECLDDSFENENELLTINSVLTYNDNSNIYPNANSTMYSSVQENSTNPVEIPLEVTLEVAHIETHSVYDSGYAQPTSYLNEQLYYNSSRGEPNVNARRCCIVGCSIRNTDAGIKLHKFPQSKQIIKKWMHNTQIHVDPKCPWRYRICSLHFEKGCFNGHRFRTGTMPTLHLGPNCPDQIYENEYHSKNDLIDNDEIDDPTLFVSDPEDYELDSDVKNDEIVAENKSGKYCQVKGCLNHLHTDGITLHKFPQLTRLWKKWQHNTQIPVDKNFPWRFRICCEHFHPQCLTNSRLLFGSVPTLKLGPDAPNELYENEFEVFKGKNEPTAVTNSNSISAYNNDYQDDDLDYKVDDDDYDNDEYDVSMTIEPEIQLQFNEDDSIVDQTNDNYGNINENLYHSKQNFTKAGMGKCCIPGCKMTRAEPGITLHKYPTPTDHFKKWLHNTQINVDLSCRWRYRVCCVHFEPDCFRGTRIIYGCVPTLHLGPNTPDFLYTNEEVFGRLDPENSTQEVARVKVENLIGSGGVDVGGNLLNKLRCSIANCSRISGQDGVSLHRLPHDELTKKKWLTICKLAETTQYQNNVFSIRICSRHFAKHCYMGPPGKRYLKPRVIPTLYIQNYQQCVNSSPQYQSSVPGLMEDSNIIYNEIKSGYGKCSLIHCQKQKSQHGVKIYKFPKSQQQQDRWTHNLRIQYDSERPWKYLICSEHFEEYCVSKRKLYRWAVPTLNLGYNVPEILFTNEESKQLYTGNESSSDDNSETEDNEPMSSSSSLLLAQNITNEENMIANNLYNGPLKQCANYKTKICCLPNCRKPRGDGIKLFRLPTSVTLIKKWEHNTGIAFNESQRNTKLICSSHFPSTLIGIRRLSKNAVPTINLGPSAPVNLHRNTFIEEEFNDDEDNDHDAHEVENHDTKIVQTEAGVAREPGIDTRDKGSEQKVVKPLNSNEEGKSQKLNDWPKATDLSSTAKSMTYKQHHCCVPHCGVARKGNLKLFRVPMDPTLRRKWEKNLSMKFDINDRNINLVCSRHFKPQLIGATRLARGSVPTLNLTPDSKLQMALTDEYNRSHIIVCNVPGCNRSNEKPDVTLFNLFLRDASILEQWCDNININIDNISIEEDGFNICNGHFEARCFMTNRKLNSWAIPTLNLGPGAVAKHLLPSLEISPKQCVVWNCQRFKGLGMHMFDFPTDKVLLAIWCSVLGVNEGINFETVKVCSAHFPSYCYKGRHLVTGAVPSLLLPNFYQKHCIVRNCPGKGQQFHFPENRNACAKWCHNLKTEQLPKLHLLQNHCVCNKHFEPYCINEDGTLHPEAVPTLELGHNDPNVFLNENFNKSSSSSSTFLNSQSSSHSLVKNEPTDFGELTAVQVWQTHSWYATDDEDDDDDDGELLLGGNS